MVAVTDDERIEELFDKVDKEKKTGELLPLPKDFYKRVREKIYVSSRTNNAGFSTTSATKLVESLKARRIQKILTYLAYGKQIPVPVPEEEELLYTQIKKLVEQEQGNKNKIKIKIVSEIPEISTPYGKKIGPYKQNEIIETNDKQDIEFILNNNIGETTN